jgi:hypothetical protein
MYLAIFLVAINVFKLAVARYFPLIGDEAFYWVWSRHLDLSYIAHPPMIAYVNFILTGLFGNSELSIRLGAILIVFLISLIIYFTGKELYGRKAGAVAAMIFNLLPTFFGGGMFLVPQTILFLFWSLSFYLLVKLLATRDSRLWYLLGITAGLGLLSDYVMALFFVGTLIFLIFNKEQRFWLTRKEPYLAFLLALFVFSPVIIWNLRQGFAPFLYWGGKMGTTPRIMDNLFNFFGLQMVLYTPPIFLITIYMIIKGFWKPETIGNRSQVSLLSIFSAVVFLPFAVISPIANVGGHWVATAYLPAIINSSQFKRFAIGTTLFFALLVNILGFTYYIFLYPTPAELKGKEFTINQQLPRFLKESNPKSGRTFYLANDIGTFGLVSFHGKVKVYSPPGLSKEMEAWGTPDIKKGDNVIYFARENTTELQKGLKPLFHRVWVEPNKRLFTKDADIPTRMQIFHCEGYLGGKLP